MTPMEVVRPHERDRISAALVDDAVVAIPHFGGYRLAALLERGAAVRALITLATSLGDGEPPTCVIGGESQAPPLASEWDIGAQRLSERMWPGAVTIMVPASPELVGLAGDEDGTLRIAVASIRPVRALCDEVGPLLTFGLLDTHGEMVETPADVLLRCTDATVSMVVDGGRCGGLGPTVVDCTRTPPVVQREGKVPGSYVDAVLMMAAFKRRRWFSRRKSTDIAGS